MDKAKRAALLRWDLGVSLEAFRHAQLFFANAIGAVEHRFYANAYTACFEDVARSIQNRGGMAGEW